MRPDIAAILSLAVLGIIGIARIVLEDSSEIGAGGGLLIAGSTIFVLTAVYVLALRKSPEFEISRQFAYILLFGTALYALGFVLTTFVS